MSVPYSYSIMTIEIFSWDMDWIFLTPDRVPTDSSIGFSSLTSSGLAPAYTAVIIIIGKFISGVSSILEENTEDRPNTSRQRTARTVVMGLFRTLFVIPILPPPY